MNLLIMGRPGAGKGTQAQIIREFYKIPHISTGDMFRAAKAKRTRLGLIAQEYMDSGQLVPDEVTIGVVQERLLEEDCKKGFLLDGFPRTIAQAEALDKMLKANGMKLDAVLYIDVPVNILISRMVGRRSCEKCGNAYHIEFNPPKVVDVCDNCGGKLYQRDDDKEATCKKRLGVYDQKTAPLLEYYTKRDLLKTVNGNQSLEQVFEDIKVVLGA